MASLNCGVTVALLGVLLLGAARLPRGMGECGAEGTLGAEGRDRPPVDAWRRGARVAEGAGWGGSGAVRGVPGTARRRGLGGAVTVPSWIPRHLAQDAGLAWHAGSPAVGRLSRAPREKEEGRARGNRARGPR